MTTPCSGPISILDIQNEWGGSAPTSINEYYGVASGVPTSGQVSWSDYYCKSAYIPGSVTYATPGAYTFTAPYTRTYTVIIIGAGGGGYGGGFGISNLPYKRIGNSFYWGTGSGTGSYDLYRNSDPHSGGEHTDDDGSCGFGGGAVHTSVSLTAGQSYTVGVGSGGAGGKCWFGYNVGAYVLPGGGGVVYGKYSSTGGAGGASYISGPGVSLVAAGGAGGNIDCTGNDGDAPCYGSNSSDIWVSRSYYTSLFGAETCGAYQGCTVPGGNGIYGGGGAGGKGGNNCHIYQLYATVDDGSGTFTYSLVGYRGGTDGGNGGGGWVRISW